MICRFSFFWSHFDLVKQANLGILGISRSVHGGNGLKFFMVMYLDHLQNGSYYGHSLLIFNFWHYFDLLKRVKVGFSGHFGHALWIFLIMLPPSWNWSYLGFLGIIWRTGGSKCRGGGEGIFPTLCIKFCLVLLNAIYTQQLTHVFCDFFCEVWLMFCWYHYSALCSIMVYCTAL